MSPPAARRTGPQILEEGGGTNSETGRGPAEAARTSAGEADATSAETPGGDMGRDATHPDRAPRVGGPRRGLRLLLPAGRRRILTGAGHARISSAPTIWARCSTTRPDRADRREWLRLADPGRSALPEDRGARRQLGVSSPSASRRCRRRLRRLVRPGALFANYLIPDGTSTRHRMHRVDRTRRGRGRSWCWSRVARCSSSAGTSGRSSPPHSPRPGERPLPTHD